MSASSLQMEWEMYNILTLKKNKNLNLCLSLSISDLTVQKETFPNNLIDSVLMRLRLR